MWKYKLKYLSVYELVWVNKRVFGQEVVVPVSKTIFCLFTEPITVLLQKHTILHKSKSSISSELYDSNIRCSAGSQHSLSSTYTLRARAFVSICANLR
jgi:hypothetical protein